MSKEPIRIGIIGCGWIANAKHLPSLTRQSNAHIRALCDILPDRAEKARQEYGAKHAYSCVDYRKVIDDKNIDAVVICTPNNTHAEITIAALDAGKHVLCEKPMAHDYEDALRMHQAAENSSCLLSIAFQNRFRTDSQYLHQLSRNGYFGDIYRIRASALRRRGVPTWGVFLNKSVQGGGPLIDIGSHALDLSFWLLNDYSVKYVAGNCFHKLSELENAANQFGPWNPEVFEVEDSASAMIVMNNGAIITLDCSYAINLEVPFERPCVTLCGTKAGAEMGNPLRLNADVGGRLQSTTVDLETGGHPPDGRQETAGEMEARLFLEAIIHNTTPYVKTSEALMVSRVVDAVYESSTTGLPVVFN